MPTICCVCHVRLKSEPKGNTSHGLCRRHALEALSMGDLLTPAEAVELAALRLA
jgi:hypothetical protein